MASLVATWFYLLPLAPMVSSWIPHKAAQDLAITFSAINSLLCPLPTSTRPLVGAVVRRPHPPSLYMADYNVILGTNTADNLIVSNTAGDDSLSLLSGNDTVTGSGGVDRAVLGSGNDLLTQPGDYTGGSIFGGSGNDTLSTASKFDDSAFEGESNNDFIELTKGSTTFSGVTLSGGLANDTITLVSTSTFKNSSVYGGGTSATSTDGADSITLGAVNSSFARGNGGADTFNIAGTHYLHHCSWR